MAHTAVFLFLYFTQLTLFVNESLIQKYHWIQYKNAQPVVVMSERNELFWTSKATESLFIRQNFNNVFWQWIFWLQLGIYKTSKILLCTKLLEINWTFHISKQITSTWTFWLKIMKQITFSHAMIFARQIWTICTVTSALMHIFVLQIRSCS